MPEAALDGIKVIDLTHHVAGPYCTKLLADFGAEVTKIERPGTGDAARRMGPFYHDEPHPEKSLPFLYLNTNKRSVTLDLKSATGRHILKKMVRDANVLIENFSPAVLPALGLDYESLKELNPALVMVSISNFGQSGPYRDYKATDIVEYALSGMMYIFGSNNREPLKHALHQAQFKAGTDAAVAATIALFQQQLTGTGQRVDVSIQECIASALRDTTSLYTYMGAIKLRQPEYGDDIPRGPMKVSDGYVVPISFGGVDWKTIADFLDAPALNDDRFATLAERANNAPELQEALSEAFGKWEKADLFYAAHQRRGLIYGILQSPKEVTESPQYQARNYFVNIEHPVIGKATYPGAPFIMSETPWRARSPAPTLGQHNQEVLHDKLGYSLQELVLLNASGVT